MYIYVCMYYVCMCVRMYVYVCVYVRICVCVCMYVCVCVCIMYVYVCMYYVCMYMYVYVCMYVCVYVYTYVCMYVRTCVCVADSSAIFASEHSKDEAMLAMFVSFSLPVCVGGRNKLLAENWNLVCFCFGYVVIGQCQDRKVVSVSLRLMQLFADQFKVA